MERALERLRTKSARFPWWTLPVALAGTGLAARLSLTHPGLPIDDAYIYQVYAANLANGHGLSFNPGETSFGVTSNLWALILAMLDRLSGTGDAPSLAQSLTLMLGLLTLVQAQRLVQRLTRSRIAGVVAGLTVATAPALWMQSLSGMDTQAVMLVWLTLLIQLARHGLGQPVRLGVLLGLMALFRPEMIWPLPLVMMAALMPRTGLARPLRNMALVGVAALLVMLPNLIFVYAHTGHPLPTTFYGKSLAAQAGVAQWDWADRAVRTIALGLGGMGDMLRVQLWTAAQLVLWMGLIYGMIRLWRFLRWQEMRDNAGLALALSAVMLGLPFLFAAGLPVHPHDGGYFHRYFSPAILTLPLLGWTGLWRGFLFERPQGRPLLAGLFFVAGLTANAWNLPAKWQGVMEDYEKIVAQNTLLRQTVARRIDSELPPEARLLVGQSGLGVIGLHANRYCKDEGALINPDIFPYYEPVQGAGQEARWRALRQYMRDQKLDYWVTVPADRSSVFAPGELAEVLSVSIPHELAWGGLTQLVVYRFDPQDSGG